MRRVVVAGSEHVLDGFDEDGFCSARRCLAEFLAEQCLEGFGEFAGDVVAVVDEQSGEERL